MIMGEDNCCVKCTDRYRPQRLSRESDLGGSYCWNFILYDDKKWMVEGIDGDDATTSNTDNVVICLIFLLQI